MNYLLAFFLLKSSLAKIMNSTCSWNFQCNGRNFCSETFHSWWIHFIKIHLETRKFRIMDFVIFYFATFDLNELIRNKMEIRLSFVCACNDKRIGESKTLPTDHCPPYLIVDIIFGSTINIRIRRLHKIWFNSGLMFNSTYSFVNSEWETSRVGLVIFFE